MNRVSDLGLIIAALIVAAGLMFSQGKDPTAWLFTCTAGLMFYQGMKHSSDDEDDEDE